MESLNDRTSNFGRNKYQYQRLLSMRRTKLHDGRKFLKDGIDKCVPQKNIQSSVYNDNCEKGIFFKPKLPKSFYITKLREWAEEIPIIGLQSEWEDNIIQLIFDTREFRYPQHVQELFHEVRRMYVNDMQQLAIELTVVKNDKKSSEYVGDICITNSNYNTKDTCRMARFVKHRDSLESKYFLSHSVMRHIIDVSLSVIIPQIIVDFSNYHACGLIPLTEMRIIMKNDVKNGSLQINDKYYKKVAEIISISKPLREISPNIQQFMRCATNLFVQQILYIKILTVKHMIDALKFNQYCPQIEFVLVVENESLKIKPSIEDVKTMYRDVIWDIEKIGRNLLSFKMSSQNKSNIANHDDYMRIKMPDWFIEESQHELEKIITDLYEPLNNYCRNIETEFNYVCAHETRRTIENLVAGDYNYDIYYEHVKKFTTYLKRANAMVPFLHYRVGRLGQIQAKEALKVNISDIIRILVDKLVNYHWEYNCSIYQEFKKFESGALEIPNNVKALIELNDKMVVNSKTIIDNLERKIKKSIAMLIILFDVAILTEEHIELNVKTINCLSSIKDILIQSNTLCEAMKSELEDELQKKINTMNIDIDNMFPTLIILNDMDDANRVHEYSEYLEILVGNIKQIDERIQAINLEERLFKFPETHFPNVSNIKKIVLPFFSLNHMISDWKRYNAVWLDGPFEFIDPQQVGKLIDFYFNQFTYLNKSMKTCIKSDMSSCRLFRFSGMIDDPDPMQQPAPMKLCFQALEQINEFKQYVSLIECICNSALEQRHWNEMSEIYGCDITPNAGTTLRKLIAYNLMDNIDKFIVIAISANKELALQRQLENMNEQWNHVSFAIRYDELQGRLIFINCNEIQVRLDEHLVFIQGMRGSYFVKPIEHRVEKYNNCLILICDIIKQFNIIQNECFFLRPIFTNNKEFKGALVNVATIYFQIEKTINDMTESISRRPTFHDIAGSPGYLIGLLATKDKIEVVNKSVCEYLNNMRLFFPRFFFQSDNELVMILFKEDAIEKVKSLFRKCFQGMRNVRVNSSKTKITAIISDHNEELNLKEKILCNQVDTNDWIKVAEIAIINAIRDDIYRYINNIHMEANTNLISINNFSSGISAECTIQIIWTSRIQKCFIEYRLDELTSILNIQNSIISTVINDLKHELMVNKRIFVMGLATVVFHQREIINLLIRKKVSHDNDFNWIAQLRYYWNEDNVIVGLMNDSRQYGYEFSTITEPTISTALTDRCYRTIVEAGRHHLFTTLIGHAATGKTETIRGLTRAFAVPFYIIKCSTNLSCEQVSKMFKGLIACGTWVCFKNIDALRLSILSVATHQIHLISQMLSSKCTRVYFDGSLLSLKPGGFIITTANFHHSSMTSHQRELPDNFRALFRVVAFQRPDISKICETRLFAAGFTNAKILANKIQLIYKLCIEHFSYVKRYDFGCRALNTVLRSAINIKFGYPNYNEDTVVLRSLIDVHLPAFTNSDMHTFQQFLHDIFPKINLPSANYEPLLKTLDQVTKNNNLQAHKLFKLKIIQALEMTYLRRVFMIIGDALSGKTTLLRTLAQCLSKNIQLEVINQISMTSKSLFGYLNEKSNRWCDGVYTALLRNYNGNNEPMNNVKTWIIFDGPVESIWMEHLNIILDNNDNRTLALPTGETIKMSDSISVILETDSIEETSPAIVSRCGIIILEQERFGYKHHIAAWVLGLEFHDKYNEFIRLFVEWSLDSCLNFVCSTCQFTIAVEKIYLVVSTLRLCTIYMRSAVEFMDEKDWNNFEIWCQAAVIQSIIWTFGACLSTSSCVLLNEFCTLLWTYDDIDNEPPKEIRQYEISLPSEGMIQDNTFIFKGMGCWKNWGEILKTESAVTLAFEFEFPFVPTIDTIKHMFIFNNHIKYRIPFLVCGDTSTGKTSLMQFFLKKNLSNIKYMINFFNFPRTTDAQQAQRIFLRKLNRIMEDRYAPPRNKFCMNFIDDFNIVSITDNCDERKSILELIRQYNDHNHWYNLKKPEKLFIDNIMFSCALTVNGRDYGRMLCSRFIGHFNLYTLSVPTRESIMKIFSNTLLYNLKKNFFTADVMSTVNCMVNATIDIYTSIIDKFKPTPINFQCQFNIHDISRVINGCSLIHRESAETKVTLIRLWVHESIRVFGDRMKDQVDSEWLFLNIKSAIKTHFKDSFESIFDHLPKENNQLTHESVKNIVFTNFMEVDKETINRRYEEVGSIQLLKNKIIHYLNELNNNCAAKLDILLLPDVLEHLIRVCRILCIPGGNLLMICAGGSGRKSLTRLAAYIERHDFFQCTSNEYFDFNQWREKLKCIVKVCGGVGKQCTFFIPSRYMKDENVEDINSIMTTGEIPHLISLDERQTIVKIARLPAQNGDRNLEISIADVMDYFFNQCRKKLHFILYFNISNCSNVRRQTQLYPSLLKYSYIDYFMSWPIEAYLQLGNKYIDDVSIENIVKEKIVIACKHFYDESKEIGAKYHKKYGRRTHVTPSAFIHMMQLYGVQMLDKQQSLMASRNKYLGGLEKLQLAAQEVSQMQETLRALRPELEFSARKTEETMREIEGENVSVENATIQVKRDEEIANKTARIAATLKSECEADLAVAIPILEDAIAALNTLKPSDITLVKAMKNPPDTVKLVMAAVCVMLDVAAERVIDPITGRKSMDFWGPSKRVLGDMNFLQTLKDYDKDNIPSAVMQIIKKTYMTDKNFMPHIVTKASSAAEGLCKWVRAMVSYDEVAKIVAPKKEKLAAAEKECNECMVFLNETRKTLAALNDKLTALNASLQATLTKKFELENEVKICTQKLVKAEALIASLADEKSKWLQSADKLEQSYDNLAGDILISSGIIAYLAPYHFVHRNKIVASWIDYVKHHLNVPCSSNYDFVDCLESEMKISSWHQCGLPKNRFAHENAVILNNSMQCCLFIDPQGQADVWIRGMEQHNQLIVIDLADPNYLRNIVRGIELDHSILVENITDDKCSAQSVDCILSRVINDFGDNFNRNEFPQLKKNCNNCNSTETRSNYFINYNGKLRLYMTTKLDNPHFHHDIFSKLTIIDFALTEDALQSKLLDIVISRERPEIHEKFDLLLDHSASNMRLLKQEEDNILTILSTSTVNILQDDESMEILDISKNQSLKIMKNEKYVKIAKNEIDVFRESYAEFTRYCAILYKTLSPLSNLNCFYKFSLKWFIHVYSKSIVNSRRSVIIQQRVQYLMSSFVTTLHSSVLIVLLDKHRLLYSFSLCLEMQLYTGHVKLEEIEFFMSDNLCDIIEADIDMGIKPHWLSENSWKEVNSLSKNISTFRGLDMSMKNEESLWLTFYNSKNPKNHFLPHQWRKLLTPFQMLIIFKIVRPDRTVIEIEHFVTNVNCAFDIHPTQNCSDSYSQSSCFIPLIFILPSYIEPLKQVQDLAATMGYTSKLISLSLGYNTEEDACNAILHAQAQGEWVLLENCHLANPWMSQLDKIYKAMDTSNTALEFRLWLSTATTPQFPINILQNGIKIISDTPTGLKQTLNNCYQSDPLNNLSVFASCPGKDKILAKFIYAFTFFHALLKERNYLGIHGWNVNYDFCHSDLTMSISQLQTFVKNNSIIANTSLESLLHLVGECNYGGKFVDSMDIRCLKTIFQDYCNTNIIIHDNYLFSVDYTIPDRCERRDFIEHIKSLPDYPSPELFGIGEDSMINRNTLIVNDFFFQISLLNGSMDNDDTLLKEDIVAMNVEMVRNKLPLVLDIEKLKEKYCGQNALNEVLVQEVIAYNSLLQYIEKSLKRPNDKFVRALQFNTLPTHWHFFPIYRHHQTSLSKFIDRLNKQYDFFYKWISGECPTRFWLGIFALPRRFISITRVMFAKHYKIPIDQLAFDFQVLSMESPPIHDSYPPDERVLYLHGLYLSGAGWNVNNGQLMASNLKVLAQLMPVILWRPKFLDEKLLQNNYSCPLYKSTVGRDLIDHAGDSSNFIISIPLSTNLHEDYWIKRGTALFCQHE